MNNYCLMYKIRVLIFVFILSTILPMFSYATNDFEILLVDNGNAIVIIEYKGDGGYVYIPNNIDNIPVISLGHVKYNGFRNKDLTAIDIPDGVRTIEDETFLGNSLMQIRIGANVNIFPNSFPNDFYTFYNQRGRKEGTYFLGNEEWSTTFVQVWDDIYRSELDSLYKPTDKSAVYDVPPEVLVRVQPIFPEFARRVNLQGEVILDVEILIDGRVGGVEVFQSLQPGPGGVDEAAIEAVRQWKYQPAQNAGQPIACWIKVEVKY